MVPDNLPAPPPHRDLPVPLLPDDLDRPTPLLPVPLLPDNLDRPMPLLPDDLNYQEPQPNNLPPPNLDLPNQAPPQDMKVDESIVILGTFHQGQEEYFDYFTRGATARQCCAMASTFLVKYHTLENRFANLTTAIMDLILTTGHKVFCLFRQNHIIAKTSPPMILGEELTDLCKCITIRDVNYKVEAEIYQNGEIKLFAGSIYFRPHMDTNLDSFINHQYFIEHPTSIIMLGASAMALHAQSVDIKSDNMIITLFDSHEDSIYGKATVRRFKTIPNLFRYFRHFAERLPRDGAIFNLIPVKIDNSTSTIPTGMAYQDLLHRLDPQPMLLLPPPPPSPDHGAQMPTDLEVSYFFPITHPTT